MTHARTTLFVGKPLLPGRRLAHAAPDPAHEQRGRTTQNEHPSPPEAGADEVIGERREKEPEIVARVHVPRAHLPAVFGPFLGDERASYRLFAADTDPAQHAQNGELPDVGDQAAKKRKQRVPENREHQRAHPPEAIGHRPPYHRQAPAEEEQREQHAAVVSDGARCGGDA